MQEALRQASPSGNLTKAIENGEQELTLHDTWTLCAKLLHRAIELEGVEDGEITRHWMLRLCNFWWQTSEKGSLGEVWKTVSN